MRRLSSYGFSNPRVVVWIRVGIGVWLLALGSFLGLFESDDCSDLWYDPGVNPHYSYPKVGLCVVQRTSRWLIQTRRLQRRIRRHPTVIRRLRIGIRRLRTATRRPLNRTRSPAIRNLPRGLVNRIAAPRGATAQPIFAIGKLALVWIRRRRGLLLGALCILWLLMLNSSRLRDLVLVRDKTDELAHQALHDALTGLLNRVLVIDRATQMLGRAQRIHAPAAALFIDLDDFQQINDRFGHPAGDELLQTIAARLQAVVRGGDTVGRLAGDEFVALVEPGSFEIAPELVAERILEVLRQPITLRTPSPSTVTITASMGVATAQGLSAEALMREAHVALYEAKQTGRDRYVLFHSAMQATLQGRLLLQIDLGEALDREELFLLYQPTLDLQSERVVGVEALIRWRHPVRGIVQPNDFIPLAEETALIVPIGRWVLTEACKQAAVWHDESRSVQVSVNVSARQLDHKNLLEDVQGALTDSQLEPTSLTLEITETALMRDADSTAQQLKKLKALGQGYLFARPLLLEDIQGYLQPMGVRPRLGVGEVHSHE
jgi:diguanylate cyclase (GGDEF)-like protein